MLQFLSATMIESVKGGTSGRNFLLLLMCILCMLACAGGSLNVRVSCIESERQALLAFKKGLVDPSNVLASWTSGEEDCCRWRGVGCHNLTGHVIKLDIQQPLDVEGYRMELNGIYGEISPSLLQLLYLSHLNLSYNAFTSVPKVISSLTRLTYLDMSCNNISGTFPYHLGNLSMLEYLDLSANDFMTADNFEWLARLSSLRVLSLSDVNFAKVENWFQVIKVHPSLSTLDLHYCDFPKINSSSTSFINSSNSLSVLRLSQNDFNPSTLSWLFNLSTALVQLEVASNDLKGPIPNSIGDMICLENLDLSYNLVEGGLPSSFQKLCRLKVLDLTSNHLSVPIDDILQNLGCATKSLEELRLARNQLTGSIRVFSKFESLRLLEVSGNQLIGPLPDFNKLPTLVVLRMNDNSFNGSLPKSVANLSDLTVLDLSSNSLHSVVSEAHLGSLSKLQELGLSDNSFTLISSSDWIPPFQLQTIKLRSCKLGPHFPRWIQIQDKLSQLDISNSEISDAIPIWIWNFSSALTYLNLSFNHIYGQIPNLPMEFSNFPAIDLSYNSFHGPVPQFLSHAGSLNLATNKFSGTLSFLCSATTDYVMNFLDLSDNQLSGGLTDCWVQLMQLTIVNLEANNLSGAIPSSIGSLLGLKTLRLSKNNFVGELPTSLQNCSELELLDVGENKLSGVVPAWIGESLTELVVLRLRSNKFYGNIPSKMCHIKSLQILDLAFNNISGSIPTCLNNLTAMVSTGFLRNTLSIEYIWPNWSDQSLGEDYRISSMYVDYTSIFWKGVEQTYGRTLDLLRLIDLSSNKLIGDIPSEVTELLGLISLNLSRNNLGGIIPENIGQLKVLEALDLSCNNLSGKIPSSLATTTFLSKLDLSDNNLTGRIPTSTQLQSFGASSYMGNIGLCGCPLPIKCSGDSSGCLDDKRRQEAAAPVGLPNNAEENNGLFDKTSLYAGMGVGFAAGFSGFCCFLMVNTAWRQAYFGYLTKMGDGFFLFMALKIARRGLNG